MKSVFKALLIPFMLNPSLAYAAVDQSGYPARCHVYRVCEEETCVRTNFPFSTVILQRDESGYSLLTSGMTQRIELGYFESLEHAKNSVKTTKERGFSSIVIPNDEIADAFGMDLRAVRTTGTGNAYVSETVTKIACSRIVGELN